MESKEISSISKNSSDAVELSSNLSFANSAVTYIWDWRISL